jgi:hypothetical protein
MYHCCLRVRVAPTACDGKKRTTSVVVQLALFELVLPNRDNAIVWCLYFLLNIILVGGSNILFVYVIIYQPSDLQTFAQIVMACFKIAWNQYMTDVLDWLVVTFNKGNMSTDSYASLQHLVLILNFIVVPCVVVMCSSPSCFYNFFVAAPTVNAVFIVGSSCELVSSDTGDCLVYITTASATSYAPPFTYNYQCSSSLLTSYAPAFLNVCLISMFVAPFAQHLAYQLFLRSDVGSTWQKMLLAVLPNLLKPIDFGSTGTSSLTANQPTTPTTSTTKSVLQPDKILNFVISTLAVLFTFGAAFPPLAVSLLATLLAGLVLTKLRLGRYISQAKEDQVPHLIDIIDAECSKIPAPDVLYKAIWMLTTASCWFYTIFLFDALGDAVGFTAALWVLVVVPLLPVVMYVLYAELDRRKLWPDGSISSSSGSSGSSRECKTGTSADRSGALFELRTLNDTRFSTESANVSSPDVETTNVLHTASSRV